MYMEVKRGKRKVEARKERRKKTINPYKIRVFAPNVFALQM